MVAVAGGSETKEKSQERGTNEKGRRNIELILKGRKKW